MYCTNLSTLNVNGLADRGKREQIDIFLANQGVQLCLLQETNLRHQEYQMDNGTFQVIPTDRHKAGLGLWLSKQSNLKVENIIDLAPTNIQEITLYSQSMPDQKTIVFNIHLPHQNKEAIQVLNIWINRMKTLGYPVITPEVPDRINIRGKHKDVECKLEEEKFCQNEIEGYIIPFEDEEEVDNLYDLPGSESQKANLHNLPSENPEVTLHYSKIIVAGDFNTILNNDMDTDTALQRRRQIVSIFECVFQALNLVDVFRTLNPEKKAFTHASSRLDYLFIEKTDILKVREVKFIDVSRSDHKMVSMITHSDNRERKRQPAYWKFKNYLLQDKRYTKGMQDYLKTRIAGTQEVDRDSLWWDQMKMEIACYTRNFQNFWRTKNRPFKCPNVSQINQDILLETRPKYNTKHWYREPAEILYLKGDQDRLIEEEDEIQEELVAFYTALFSSERKHMTMNDLDMDISCSLTEVSREMCEEDYTLSELYEAAAGLNRNKTPGYDGITLEFYLFFWELLGQPLFNIFTDLVNGQCLRGTSAVGIVALIQKNGDPQRINNWHPITLMAVDLKIFCKSIANRIKKVITEVVSEGQTGIPGRTIHWNLMVIRDIITWASRQKRSLTVLSIDQKKAFDRVNHDFLFMTMQSMGFGPKLISTLKATYSNYSVVIKNGRTLTRQVPFCRGIRQGDPLSSALYAMALEPVLRLASSRLEKWAFSLGGAKKDAKILWSAYADDITFFLTDQTAIEEVFSVFDEIAAYSEADINITKSCALSLFDEMELDDDTHGQHVKQSMKITRKTSEIKILGITFSVKDQRLHICQFQDIMGRTKMMIARNQDRLIAMTYQMRARWVNVRIWPRWLFVLKCLHPTADQIGALQKIMVDVIWMGGKHWLPLMTLIRPINEGGLALVDIESKLSAIRISTLVRVMVHPEFSFQYRLTEAFLDEYGGMRIGYAVLHIRPRTIHLGNLPEVYSSSLSYWDEAGIMYDVKSVGQILEMPIADNRFLFQTDIPIIVTPGQAREKNILSIGDALHMSEQKTRFWKSIGKKIQATIDVWQAERDLEIELDNESRRELEISQEVMEKQQETLHRSKCTGEAHFVYRLLINTEEYETELLTEMTPKMLYVIAKSKKVNALPACCQEVPEKAWYTAFNRVSPPAHNNMQWRFLHGVHLTQGMICHIRKKDTTECLLCGGPDNTDEHMYRGCPVTRSLRKTVWGIMDSFGYSPTKDEEVFLFHSNSFSDSLATALLKTYRYIIMTLLRHTESIKTPSGRKLKSSFFEHIAKHMRMTNSRLPISNNLLLTFWQTWTFRDIIVTSRKGEWKIRNENGDLESI